MVWVKDIISLEHLLFPKMVKMVKCYANRVGVVFKPDMKWIQQVTSIHNHSFNVMERAGVPNVLYTVYVHI